jgi:hypothetical protein
MTAAAIVSELAAWSEERRVEHTVTGAPDLPMTVPRRTRHVFCPDVVVCTLRRDDQRPTWRLTKVSVGGFRRLSTGGLSTRASGEISWTGTSLALTLPDWLRTIADKALSEAGQSVAR